MEPLVTVVVGGRSWELPALVAFNWPNDPRTRSYSAGEHKELPVTHIHNHACFNLYVEDDVSSEVIHDCIRGRDLVNWRDLLRQLNRERARVVEVLPQVYAALPEEPQAWRVDCECHICQSVRTWGIFPGAAAIRERGQWAAEQVRQQAEWQQQEAARRRAWDEANALAEQLWLSSLTPEQRREWDQRRYVTVEGRERVWRVCEGSSGNLRSRTRTSSYWRRLCLVFYSSGLPTWDLYYAQKRLIEWDERYVLDTALGA